MKRKFASSVLLLAGTLAGGAAQASSHDSQFALLFGSVQHAAAFYPIFLYVLGAVAYGAFILLLGRFVGFSESIKDREEAQADRAKG